MKDFKELTVWRKSHDLTLKIYQASRAFPKEELYGLTNQMRRSSSSIGANIAEGCGRKGDVELARFLQIAMGSASELEYHLLLAHDLGLLEGSLYKLLNSAVCEVKKMLAAVIMKLSSVSNQPKAEC